MQVNHFLYQFAMVKGATKPIQNHHQSATGGETSPQPKMMTVQKLHSAISPLLTCLWELSRFHTRESWLAWFPASMFIFNMFGSFFLMTPRIYFENVIVFP